jgi:hypothetical protein
MPPRTVAIAAHSYSPIHWDLAMATAGDGGRREEGKKKKKWRQAR